VRRRILLTVAAATSLVLLAFLLPLGVLVKEVAANRAESAATLQIQALVPLVGTVSRTHLKLALEQVNSESNAPVTVFLPDGTTLGAPAARTEQVRAAALGAAFTHQAPGGLELLVPVQGLADDGKAGTAVIRVLVPDGQLSEGVLRARLVLLGLGVVLLGLGLAVGSAVARSFVRPVRDLAATADRLAAGDLDARVTPAGPPEVKAVGEELNRLAARIADLLAAEREIVADLAHRLRTPVTALRLDSETLRDPEERARLVSDADAVSAGVDEVIREARRPMGERGAPYCDAATVVRDRSRFWAVLAHDQGRALQVDVSPQAVLVRTSGAELATALDALVGNVFQHTPTGTGFRISLQPHLDGGAQLVVQDEGPGQADDTVVNRGASGAGSSGLGLDIVRRTADDSGGSLSVVSGPTGGFAVVVYLGPAPEGTALPTPVSRPTGAGGTG
jgi:signal transduction histidine kinase